MICSPVTGEARLFSGLKIESGMVKRISRTCRCGIQERGVVRSGRPLTNKQLQAVCILVHQRHSVASIAPYTLYIFSAHLSPPPFCRLTDACCSPRTSPRMQQQLLLQAQTENDDTLALLDCLGEGAAAEEGGPLREVCAKGVVEFLRYAIKQSTKRQQARGMLNFYF